MKKHKLLVLPRIVVENAGAMPSSYTVGFPAVSSFLGAVHALERRLGKIPLLEQFEAGGTAIVSHSFHLKSYKEDSMYYAKTMLARKPLVRTGKGIVGAPFIPDVKCDMEVTLVVDFSGVDMDDHDSLIHHAEQQMLGGMKLAGGDIFSMDTPYLAKIIDECDAKSFKRSLMPGYILQDRSSLIAELMEDTGCDAMEAVLDYVSVKNRSELVQNVENATSLLADVDAFLPEENTGSDQVAGFSSDDGCDDKKVVWKSRRKNKGWMVPITSGFQAVSPVYAPGETVKARDTSCPHVFCEAVVTLGEFITPVRVGPIGDMLWQYHHDTENNLYMCQQASK